MKRYKLITSLPLLLLTLLFMLSGCSLFGKETPNISLDDIPPFTNSPYVVINGNDPFFTDDEITNKAFEHYSELDSLGRCGVATASIGIEIMPTDDRGDIGQIKPSGWHSVKYDIVDGKYLYNRCHLIAFRLAGENANEKNLITGTRYMNNTGMIPFEDMVADYVKETANHVMYRVTPIFKDSELVARGVLIEALSVEDKGQGIRFNVFVYNAQPGITINYTDGTSALSGEPLPTATPSPTPDINAKEYVLNANGKKIHIPDCRYVKDIKEENKQTVIINIQTLLDDGYVACKNCKPE